MEAACGHGLHAATGVVSALCLFATTASAAASTLSISASNLRNRANASMSCAETGSVRLLDALATAAALTKARLAARCRHLEDKLFLERAEEASSNESLLEALAALSSSSHLAAEVCLRLLSLHFDSLPHYFFEASHGFSSVLATSLSDTFPTLLSSTLELFTLWCDSVDPAASEVSGLGCHSYWTGPARVNRITLVPRIRNGTIAEYVTTPDVSVIMSYIAASGERFECGGASVSVDSAHHVHINYEVSGDLPNTEIQVVVLICGHVLVWSNTIPKERIAGTYSHTLKLPFGAVTGLAVTPDAQFAVVAYASDSKLLVFKLEGASIAKLLHTIPAHHPAQLCVAPRGNLLVCEVYGRRLHELTPPGVAIPTFVRNIDTVDSPYCVAMHFDLIAVGTQSYSGDAVRLMSYSSGEMLKCFGGAGIEGQMTSRCVSLCFINDGKELVAAEFNSGKLSVFSVELGRFVRRACVGVLSNGDKGLLLAPNGEIIASDNGNHRICVFNSDCSVLLRSWGKRGSDDSQFMYPALLALAGKRLLVQDSTRVQVFD